MKRFCILGTDSRSICLREMYVQGGYKISDYIDGDYIICPIPFTKDGVKITGELLEIDDIIKLPDSKSKVIISGSIPNNIRTKFELSGIKYYDIFDNDDIAILNAIPTAEGAIAKAMEMTDITLCNSDVLVMGYGRIGKILSKMLLGLGCKVYVEARKNSDLAEILSLGYTPINLKDLDRYLSKFSVIFNTIPVKLLNDNMLDLIDKKCAIIDLASAPGGVDFEYAQKLGLNVVWALALPSKVAPRTAAMYVKQACDNIVKDDKNDS